MATYDKFTHEDYMKVHELVFEAQKGNDDAKIELLDMFDDFLSKYIDLIKDGEYNLNNYAIKKFIGFFIPDPKAKKAINQHFHKPTVRYEIEQAVRLITGIFSCYDKEDIKNDLFIVFWTLCRRYKDTRPSFHNYIKMCFSYEVLSYYRPLIKNSSINNPYSHITLEEHDKQTSTGIHMEMSLNNSNKYMSIKRYTSIKAKDKSSVYEDENLNTNWITGITCSKEFQILTTYERNLIIESYLKKRTDQEIADKYGLSRATINRRKQEAKKKLFDELLKTNLVR